MRLFASVAALVLGCGGAQSSGSGASASPASAPASSTSSGSSTPAPLSDNAPGWAREGDAETGEGYRFICEGEAASEDAALESAIALCDDKICKLCGVEVESVVRTKETLTGVEMSRQVEERCRRVRKNAPSVERKVTDCYQGRCVSWVQLGYTKEAQAEECKRYADENFDDPLVCQQRIEEFRNIKGYSAASFRERVRVMDAAITSCAQIDVRPTPLMNALEEKLKVGMSTWRTHDTPSYLNNYWLQDHAPMWQRYAESDKFIARLQLLRAYLAHKVLIMDVIEASYAELTVLDTDKGFNHLMTVLRAVSKDETYGVQHVHFVGVSRVRELWSKKAMRLSPEPLAAFIRETYKVDEVTQWDERIDLVMLFCADDVITQAEWDYIHGGKTWRERSQYELLKVKNHGSHDTRLARFDQAVHKALSDVQGRPVSQQFHRVQGVIPDDGAFLLEVESRLPKDLRSGYDWKFLEDRFRRTLDELTAPAKRAFVERMLKAVATMPTEEKEAHWACSALPERMKFFESHGVSVESLETLICPCMLGQLQKEGLSYVNKGELYYRALRRGLKCVTPRS